MVWLDIIITLLSLELMAYFYYGVRALAVGGVCVAVSLAAELISLRLMHRRFTADDLSCTSDALIIALMLPASIDYKIPGIACVFTVIAAKNIFGGRKNMIFSPTAVAYIFMLTSWKSELLSYPLPHIKMGIFETAEALVDSASYTFNYTGSMSATDFEILLGSFSGPAGAVCILLLLVSAVILIFRKDISAGAFCGTILGAFLMAYLCPVAGSRIDSVKYVFVTNMLLFSAVYIISDLRTAPHKNYYAFFYGFFISVSSYVITITTGKENVIVIMSVLFTPVSLALKSLEKKILASVDAEAESAAVSDVNDELVQESVSDEAELTESSANDKNASDDGSYPEIMTEGDDRVE